MRPSGRTLVHLTKALTRTSSHELEMLALERATCFAAELHRTALSQLRTIRRLPRRLARLEVGVADQRLELGLRLGLRALTDLFTPEPSFEDADAVDLLEPALGLETALVDLRRWVRPLLEVSATREDLASLALGVAHDRRPLIAAQVDTAWDRFHRLRTLGTVNPRVCEDPAQLDGDGIERLLSGPFASAISAPPRPSLPWHPLVSNAAIPQPLINSMSMEWSTRE